MYQKNPVGEALQEINEQYIEDNIDILQDYFHNHDDLGMMCNKDNFESYFESWLENQEHEDLVKIINQSK